MAARRSQCSAAPLRQLGPAARCEDARAPLQFRMSESLGAEPTLGIRELTRAVIAQDAGSSRRSDIVN